MNENMATILAFAGSNSSTSINFQLVKYTVSLLSGYEKQLLNMANCPFPMYSADAERENGFLNSLVELKNDIQRADGLVLSVNEHNGEPSAYFKNVLDWLSRLERNFIKGAKVLLMSTSGGKRGAIGALGTIEKMLPRMGGEVVATFSLPSYHQNFDPGQGITDPGLSASHQAAINTFLASL